MSKIPLLAVLAFLITQHTVTADEGERSLDRSCHKLTEFFGEQQASTAYRAMQERKNYKISDEALKFSCTKVKNFFGEDAASDEYKRTMPSSLSPFLNAKNHYERLGVERNADRGTIRKKYLELTLQFHPDKEKQKSDVVFKIINPAYTELFNDESRNAYDKILQATHK